MLFSLPFAGTVSLNETRVKGYTLLWYSLCRLVRKVQNQNSLSWYNLVQKQSLPFVHCTEAEGKALAINVLLEIVTLPPSQEIW